MSCMQSRETSTMIAARRILLPTLILLAATTTAAVAMEAKYECSGGTHLTAAFSAPGNRPGNVVLVVAGSSGAINLPQVASADGGRYANDRIEFWIKGNSATLTRDGKSESCQTK
jgi:membrane-bound inhibitor of C-type lysozyme